MALYATPFFVFGTLLVPHIVHAFSLSALADLIAPAVDASFLSRLHSPSETPALKAALNVDPSPAKGGGDITVAGGALVPEIGPSGTAADIEVARPGADQISIYVVREGDTLSQIAELFSVSTNTIVWANDLPRGSVIRPGETLVILPVSGIRHTVQKGETLAGIVKKYKGDIDEVLSFNDLREGATLALGDTVVIPHGIAPQTATASVSAPAKGVGGPTLEGYFLRPLVGGIKSQGIHGYNAVDLAASSGTSVLASAAGEVLISRTYGYNGGYGQYIVVRHDNGTQTLYAHLSQNYVYAGTRVVQGQVIGAVGTTGRSSGPHLHFEVRGARNPF